MIWNSVAPQTSKICCNEHQAFFQSENGVEVSKISIRGSGITSEDEPLGVMFLLDGLNFNQGDGETILEEFDVASVSYAEGLSGGRCI